MCLDELALPLGGVGEDEAEEALQVGPAVLGGHQAAVEGDTWGWVVGY